MSAPASPERTQQRHQSTRSTQAHKHQPRPVPAAHRPIVAIRKDPDSPSYPWIWSCQICPGQPDLGTNFDKCADWEIALTRADNHARNHHR